MPHNENGRHQPSTINHQPLLLSLIVPVYNEAENILNVFKEVRDRISTEHELLVVYDTDEDTTVPVVQGVLDEYPGVRLVKNKYGRGALQAIQTGFEESIGSAKCVTMADLSDDLSQVDEMARLINENGYHLIAGSRYMKGGGQEGGPPFKGFLSRMAGLTLHWFAGLPLHDATNNFRVYSAELIDDIKFESDGGFELALEITVKAYAKGYRMTELPTVWKDRTAGESNFKLWKWMPKYLRWYFYALWHRGGKRDKAG